jgi:hypothetical protein
MKGGKKGWDSYTMGLLIQKVLSSATYWGANKNKQSPDTQQYQGFSLLPTETILKHF